MIVAASLVLSLAPTPGPARAVPAADAIAHPGDAVVAPGEAVVAPGETVVAPGETVAPPTDDPAAQALADAVAVKAGATCLDRARLVTQIRTWLDIDDLDPRLVVEVVGDARDPHKLAFTLRRDEHVIAVRRFEPAPKRCADLHAVVGLAIALAIDATLIETVSGDPTAGTGGDDDVAPEPAPAHDDEVPANLTRPRPPPPPRRVSPWSLRASLDGVLSFGMPPGVGGGVHFGLVARWRDALDLGFGAVGVSSGRERVGDAGALFSAIAGRVDLCGGRSFGRLHPRGCGGFLAGAALAAGQGFARATSSTLPWLAVPIGAHLEVRLTDRFGLDLGVEGLVGVTRPVFEGLTQRSELVSRAYARFGVLAGVGFTFLIWSP